MAPKMERCRWWQQFDRTAKLEGRVGRPPTGSYDPAPWCHRHRENHLSDVVGQYALAQERRIAIVDADVGQSSLGPPTTIGLGVVAAPFQRLQELPPAALYFVGATSPRGHLVPMIVGTKRLVDGAQRLEVGQVIIDTCGFISADGGQALKYYQIDLVDPDVVVCLQRGEECEPLLLAFRHGHRPRILRLRASHACRRRSLEERRDIGNGLCARIWASRRSSRCRGRTSTLSRPLLAVVQRLMSRATGIFGI